MNTEDKSTNIIGYIDREIVARVQDKKAPVATYYFEVSDTSLEMVTFCLAGGQISSTAVVPKDNFSTNSNIKYFYGDAR